MYKTMQHYTETYDNPMEWFVRWENEAQQVVAFIESCGISVTRKVLDETFLSGVGSPVSVDISLDSTLITHNLPTWIRECYKKPCIKTDYVFDSDMSRFASIIYYFTVDGINYCFSAGFKKKTTQGNNVSAICSIVGNNSSTAVRYDFEHYNMGGLDSRYKPVKGLWAIRDNITTISIIRDTNKFVLNLKNSARGNEGNVLIGHLPIDSKIEGASSPDNYFLLGNGILQKDLDGTFSKSLNMMSPYNAFKSYYSTNGDLIVNKIPMYEVFLGYTNVGFIGSLKDVIVTSNKFNDRGDLVNINGVMYFTLALGVFSNKWYGIGHASSPDSEKRFLVKC